MQNKFAKMAIFEFDVPNKALTVRRKINELITSEDRLLMLREKIVHRRNKIFHVLCEIEREINSIKRVV